MNPDYLRERVGLFSLLRSLYTYPLRVATLEAVAGLKVAGPMEGGLERMRSGLRDVHRAWRNEALNTEMTRLLEGPGLTPAVPYASYYLNDGRLMGPAALAARRFYLDWQAVPAGDIRLPDDHIALELGFLAYLAERAVADPSETYQAIRGGHDFVRLHLLPWLPRFCAALDGATGDPFFGGLAELTKTAVDNDLDWSTAALVGSPDPQAVLAQSVS